ncbi:hypothetical protein BDV59DRAFT_199827 [Aspergillus ambiguus]|uniref:uncharacterized protein n=1 Tax=Aspergillus ambiguus TaxID=176160 RepID=UPI003CCC9441
MFLFRPINLPRHILFANGTLLGLALYVTIFRSLPTIKLTAGKKDEKRQLELFIPRPTTRRITDTNVLFGLVTSGLMLPYFVSSYMPIEENQFLHASVPIRLFASAVMLGHTLVRGRRGMSEEGYWEFLGLALLDAGAAIALGCELGRFDGMVPGFSLA